MTDTVIPTEPNPDAPKADDKTALNLDTPAVVPVVDPKVEPPAGEDVVVYEPTGDVGLDMALEFIGKAGLGQYLRVYPTIWRNCSNVVYR